MVVVFVWRQMEKNIFCCFIHVKCFIFSSWIMKIIGNYPKVPSRAQILFLPWSEFKGYSLSHRVISNRSYILLRVKSSHRVYALLVSDFRIKHYIYLLLKMNGVFYKHWLQEALPWTVRLDVDTGFQALLFSISGKLII